MKVPNFLPPNELDHPGLPEVAYTAIQVLSDQLETITTALQKNMSPEDNENSEARVLYLVHGVEQEVSVQEIKGRPTEVRVIDHPLFEEAVLAWVIKDEHNIKVKVTWPSEPTGPIATTLLIRGGSDGS